MPEYTLYLESGPKQRKTIVHVLDLLGCTAQGPTTEDALVSTPEAIRTFLAFLQRHGVLVDPQQTFTTTIAEHVMEGNWLANGDPTPGFRPDFQPLVEEDLREYLQWLEWMQAELGEILRGLSTELVAEEPVSGGRSIEQIAQHLAEVYCTYMRSTVGRVSGMNEALREVDLAASNNFELADALDRLWEVTNPRLAEMSPTEREQSVQHGQITWTARRGMRRMLEDLWEHTQEILKRLEELP